MSGGRCRVGLDRQHHDEGFQPGDAGILRLTRGSSRGTAAQYIRRALDCVLLCDVRLLIVTLPTAIKAVHAVRLT